MAKVVLIQGEGRGKTTNAIGYISQQQTLGKDIVVAQFLKTGKNCGECKFFENRRNIRWIYCGREEFYISENQKEEFSQLMKEGIKKLKEELRRKNTDILLLDELGVVLSFEMLLWTEVIEVFSYVKEVIIITGRKIPASVIAKADEVVMIKEIKHPYEKGIQARIGIEY